MRYCTVSTVPFIVFGYASDPQDNSTFYFSLIFYSPMNPYYSEQHYSPKDSCMQTNSRDTL